MKPALSLSKRPYPAYKPSGVPWLGDVPGHWEAKKVKHITRHTTGWTPPTGERAGYEGSNLWATIADLGERVITDTKNRISDEAVMQASIVASPVGSLLFSFKLSVGQVSVAGVPLYTNEAIATFIPSESFVVAWAFYAFPAFIPENSATNIYGAKLLNQQRINDASLVVPPIDEQQAIANYLDTETARIDELIREKEGLIDTLREYRQATISEVVTQGLDPAAPKKPSGVPWLGEIPAHWGLKRLKFHVDQVGEKTSEPLAGVVYIGLEHIESGTGKFISSIDGTQTESESTVSHFRVGDVLFGKLRPYLAKAVIAYGDGVCTTELLVLRPHSMDSGYLLRCLLLDGFIKTVDASTFGAKMPRADWTFISNLLLPEPPVAEQQAIANYLDRETARIDMLVDHVQDEIKLLQELRAATITDAVTGRIQVS